MNRSSAARIIVSVTIVAALGWLYARHQLAPDQPPPNVPKPVLTPLPTKWARATEQEWIVAEVVRALVGMSHYATTKTAPTPATLEVRIATRAVPGGLPAFDVELPARQLKATLQVANHIWSPSLYAPLVRELLGLTVPSAAAPRPGPSESATFAALTRPRTDVMVKESERVSALLAIDMTDARAQEDAALLFAALGLREWAGMFYDNHGALCRLAAHLAMAEARRNGTEPTAAGRIAELTLSSLAFRDQPGVLARLDAFDARPRPSAAARAWSRTLRMRNTEDWRLLREPRTATLLERREYFVWVKGKLGVSQGLAFLDTNEPDGLPDWGSIMLNGGYSVEGGGRFVPLGLGEVLQDAAAMPLGLQAATDPGQLVKVLNQEPSGPVRDESGQTVVEVLDAGTWAAFVQRHLLHHVENGVDLMTSLQGLPEQAKAYQAQFAASFGGLRQYPLAARRMARDRAAHAAAMGPSLALLAARPDQVGGHNWNSLLQLPSFPADVFRVPPIETWCQPLFAAGTYFEWPKRLWLPNGHLRVRGAELGRMRASLPNYSGLVRAEVEDRLGSKASAADLRREYAPFLDYDLNLMQSVAEASKDDPVEYKRLYRRIGELNPDRLADLAVYLKDHGEEQEAAATYEAYIAKARDRVGMCNSVDWLVNYYLDHGREKRGLEVARGAAEVYCYQGLLTLANTYERLKRWPDAEEYFRRLDERYQETRARLSFYLRHRRDTGDERFRSEREALLATFFPKGIESADADPAGAPPDGVVIVGSNADAEKAGLKPGDIVVALNGSRVHNYDQYRVIRSLNTKPEMALVVWRGQYLHLAVSDPERWFGVEVRNHNGPASAEKSYF